MDLRRLEAFSKVYQLRSFSKAAQELFLSQPTVSAHIATLEEELGSRLFDRIGKTILPTKIGIALYGYTEEILRLVERAQSEIKLLQNKVVGELYLGASTIPANYILPHILAQFRKDNPAVRIDLKVGDSSEVLEAIREGRLDLGVVGAQDTHPDFEFTPIMRDELVLIASKESGIEKRSSLSSKELQALPWVMREKGSGTRKSIEEGLARLQLGVQDLNVAATVHSTEGMLKCVRSGLGVSITSRLAAEDQLSSGELMQFQVPELELKRCFYVVCHRRRQKLPVERSFFAKLLKDKGQQAGVDECLNGIS